MCSLYFDDHQIKKKITYISFLHRLLDVWNLILQIYFSFRLNDL